MPDRYASVFMRGPFKGASPFPQNVSTPNNFNLLRLLLAAMVVFCHSFSYSLGPNADDFLFPISHHQFDTGAMAVNCFFVISGFLITASWTQTKSFLEYLQKRALRIFPGMAEAILFCIFIVGPLAGVHLLSYFSNPATYRFGELFLFRDIFSVGRLPGVFEHNPVHGAIDDSLWTIRYEFLCYLLVPVIAVCGLLRQRVLLLLLFLVSQIAFHHVGGRTFAIPPTDHISLPWFASLNALARVAMFFLAGVTFFAWRDCIPHSPRLLLLAVGLLLFAQGGGHTADRLNLFLPACAAYILFYAAYAKPFLPFFSSLWEKQDLSYGIYLFGTPVLQLLVHYAMIGRIGFIMTPGGLFVCGILLTAGLASLSWRYVEKPFLKMKRRPIPAPLAAEMAVL